MLKEDTKNRMDTESKEHRSIWSNTAKGEYLAETDRQKTTTVSMGTYAECTTTRR